MGLHMRFQKGEGAMLLGGNYWCCRPQQACLNRSETEKSQFQGQAAEIWQLSRMAIKSAWSPDASCRVQMSVY